MNFSILSTAVGAAWGFVSSAAARVPFLKTFLTYASGPLGAILGPIVQGFVDAVSAVLKFALAYVKVFADGLTVTAKNLSVCAVIFAAFVGGIAYGIHLDRVYAPVPKPPQTVKAALDDLHKNFVCYKRKK